VITITIFRNAKSSATTVSIQRICFSADRDCTANSNNYQSNSDVHNNYRTVRLQGFTIGFLTRKHTSSDLQIGFISYCVCCETLLLRNEI